MTTDRAGYGVLTEESFERSRKRIGVPLRINPAHITEVSADATRHFAYGYGDDNPLYCDPEYGKNTRWGGLIAPPNFTYCMGENAAPPLTAEQKEILKGDPFAGLGSYQAAMEFEYYRPLVAGDRCRVVRAQVGVEDKPSRFGGRTAHVTHDFLYANGHGQVVTIQRGTWINAERHASKERSEDRSAGQLRPVHRRPARRDRRRLRRRDPPRCAAQVLRGRRGRRGDPAAGQGPARDHRPGGLAPRLGHAADTAWRVRHRPQDPQEGAGPVPAERAQHPRHRAAAALGAGAGAGARHPDELRLRRHAGDLADARADRLDGRRRLAAAGCAASTASSTTSATPRGSAARSSARSRPRDVTRSISRSAAGTSAASRPPRAPPSCCCRRGTARSNCPRLPPTRWTSSSRSRSRATPKMVRYF